MVENRHVEPLDDRLRGFEAAIEENRAENRFERVCQDRWAAKTAAAQLALAEPECLRNIQGLSNFVQRLLFDQVGANSGQITLVELAETLKQKRGHHAVEDRIAQELEPFVMRGTVTAMGHGLAQQFRIAKFVVQPAFQR